MSGWRMARLDEVCEKITDGTHHSPPNGPVGDFKYITAKNIKPWGLDLTDITYIDSATHREIYARCDVRKNDVLYVKDGATAGRLALNTLDEEFSLLSSVGVLRPGPSVRPKYLVYALQSPHVKDRMLADVAGVAITRLTLKKLKQAEIPLAPLEQQDSIVAEIEKQFSRLDEAVANLKRVKANLKRYKAAVLKAAVEGKLTEAWRRQHPETRPASEVLQRTEVPPRPNRYSTRSMDVIPGHAALAVGNPGTALPEGWSWSALVDIARMESGHTPSRSHPEWWEGDVPWIGIADAREHQGKLIADTVQHTNDAGLANSAARLLPTGTVCISRTASVGYVVVMAKPMATSQDFVNWTPTQAITSDWLRIVFLADREALVRFGKGSVHKTIYFPEWLSVHIAVPPIAEQNRIVSEVERLLSLADEAEAQVSTNLGRAERLRQTILAKAFNTTQSPSSMEALA